MSHTKLTIAPQSHAHATIIAGVPRAMRVSTACRLAADWLEIHIDQLERDSRAIWLQEEKHSISRQRVAEVLHELALHAFADTHRAVIIDPADALTAEAANMLLKSLEEPPEGVRFYLLASTVARILPTLRSRAAIIGVGIGQRDDAMPIAEEFLLASIPARLAIVASLDDRIAQLQLLKDLLYLCHAGRFFHAAGWLQQMISQGDKSVNLRLMLETFALRYEVVAQ